MEASTTQFWEKPECVEKLSLATSVSRRLQHHERNIACRVRYEKQGHVHTADREIVKATICRSDDDDASFSLNPGVSNHLLGA